LYFFYSVVLFLLPSCCIETTNNDILNFRNTCRTWTRYCRLIWKGIFRVAGH